MNTNIIRGTNVEVENESSGIIINGVELTVGQLREYEERSFEDYDEDDEKLLELYLRDIDECEHNNMLGVDADDENNYGGFQRIVRQKREFI